MILRPLYHVTFYFPASSYLNALQPPPYSIPTVESSTATLAQQVGDQTVPQCPSKGQDDVPMKDRSVSYLEQMTWSHLVVKHCTLVLL